MRASLWLCLGLPALALEALGLRDSPQACVLTTAVARAGAAQALEDIKVYTPRGSAERAALESLAAWCGQFTSFVSLAPPDGLLLEI
ncbi:MAG: Y-family DNA polymerase, partial [Anaerolineales bacterium]